MAIKINYNRKNIGLFYSPWFPKINKSDFLKIKVKGIGNGRTKILGDETNYFEDYKIIEEEAQIYLIKNAMDTGKARYPLEKIVAITQDTICNPIGEHFELEIILTGLAFFKKRK